MMQLKFLKRWQSTFRAIVPISHTIRQELHCGGIKSDEPVALGVSETLPATNWSPIPTVGFAGRMVWEKGVDVLIQAFANVRQTIPKARLILIGDGPERKRLEELTSALGLSSAVEFHGHQSQPVINQTLGQVWVQAVPSRWPEPLGLVALEAMMRGRAVVASCVGGLTEIVIDRKTGMLVQPGNSEALAEALLAFLTNLSVTQRYGLAGHTRVLQNFSERNFIEQTLQLYEQLLGSSYSP